jgi:hypothetical protein
MDSRKNLQSIIKVSCGYKMKILSIVFSFIISINSYSQELKTYNGTFNDNKLPNGTANYTYYEDPATRQFIKQGSFKYNFTGRDQHQGYNQSITGNFSKGLKHGTWTYTITLTDAGVQNPYFTGTATLVANYNNGYADGNWKMIWSTKTRKKLFSYGQYVWGPYDPVQTNIVSMNFKNGYIVGQVSINDEFKKYQANGSFDNNGFVTGKWIVNDRLNNINRELTHKDGYLYDYVGRDNQGAVLRSFNVADWIDSLNKAKTMSPSEREEYGFKIDTVCESNCSAIGNIQRYFKDLLSNDYFLYEYIGGDLTYKEGIKGGCEVSIKKGKFVSLSESWQYKEAEAKYSKGNLLEAYDLYKAVQKLSLKPSDEKIISDKVAKLIPEIEASFKSQKAKDEAMTKYIEKQYDSVFSDFKLVRKNFKILKENPQKPLDYGVYWNCDEPWNVANENNNDYRFFEYALECFRLNKDFYNPNQVALTEYFIKFHRTIETESKALKKSEKVHYFNNKRYYYYDYDSLVLFKNVDSAKANYFMAKQIMTMMDKFEYLEKQIENLNVEKRKKGIYTKYLIVYNDFKNVLKISTQLDNTIKILNEVNMFMEKIVSLYDTDTKELEKQLKSAESVDQIKQLFIH